MGQKLVCFGQLGPTRSCQDESKEVHEVGSKRPSSGGNGGHHVWWSGLIFRLLPKEISTAPVTAVEFASINVEIRTELEKRVLYAL